MPGRSPGLVSWWSRRRGGDVELLESEYELDDGRGRRLRRLGRGRGSGAHRWRLRGARPRRSTTALRAEGYARDVVRDVQDARKAAGLQVADRIALDRSPGRRRRAGRRPRPTRQLIAGETLATTYTVVDRGGLADRVETGQRAAEGQEAVIACHATRPRSVATPGAGRRRAASGRKTSRQHGRPREREQHRVVGQHAVGDAGRVAEQLARRRRRSPRPGSTAPRLPSQSGIVSGATNRFDVNASGHTSTCTAISPPSPRSARPR